MPFLAGAHLVDRKVEVRTVGRGVAGRSDIADQRAARDLASLDDARRIVPEVGIIIGPAPVIRALGSVGE